MTLDGFDHDIHLPFAFIEIRIHQIETVAFKGLNAFSPLRSPNMKYIPLEQLDDQTEQLTKPG